VKDKPTILLSGYPKQQNLNSKKVAQYWGEMSFKSFKDSFVNYTKSFTGPGHSGSPLILKEEVKIMIMFTQSSGFTREAEAC
jgi:V8-like Glu-specific endopeptidase